MDDRMVYETNRRVGDRKMAERAMRDSRMLRVRKIVSRFFLIVAVALTLLANVNTGIANWQTLSLDFMGLSLAMLGMAVGYWRNE